jgi:flagellar basal-body rod protein FlgG
MNLSLYSAATGMEAQQLNLNTIANNLANVNTPGFKRSKIEFQDLLYQKPRASGSDSGGGNLVPTGIEIGNGSRVAATSKVFTQGQLTNTGEKLDVAIQGDGFFEVQRPDGTIGYTRDGSFKLNAQGQVVTVDGMPVLSGMQTIPAGANVTISEDGQVTVQSASGTTNFRLTLTRFANPAGLRSMGGNLYEETAASGTPETGNRRRATRARTASAAPCRATSRPRTSTSSKKWSPSSSRSAPTKLIPSPCNPPTRCCKTSPR